jgi:putative addiction module killer protein
MAYHRGYTVRELILRDGTVPFADWLAELDRTTRARIQARVFRFESGNLGDAKSVGGGVLEARLDFGPGWRLYFGIFRQSVVLLLVGGSKRTQPRDIACAQVYWHDFLEAHKYVPPQS